MWVDNGKSKQPVEVKVQSQMSPNKMYATCLISKAYLIRQKSCNPDTNLPLKKPNNLRSKVTNHSMRHMPNINSISRKTNKLQPGHELVIEKAIIGHQPWYASHCLEVIYLHV